MQLHSTSLPSKPGWKTEFLCTLQDNKASICPAGQADAGSCLVSFKTAPCRAFMHTEEQGRGALKSGEAAQGTPTLGTGRPHSHGQTLPPSTGATPASSKSTKSSQTVPLPSMVVSCGKTTLVSALERNPILFKIKSHQKESSLQCTFHLITQSTSQSPGCCLGTAPHTSSTLQKPALSSWIRSWPQK